MYLLVVLKTVIFDHKISQIKVQTFNQFFFLDILICVLYLLSGKKTESKFNTKVKKIR